MRRLCRIGTSERLSAPPAIPTSTWPSRIEEATSAIAWFAEAQARLTVWAGTAFGRPGPERHLAAEVRSLDRGDHLPHHQRADRGGIDLRALERARGRRPSPGRRPSGPGTPCPSGRTACGIRPRSRLFDCSWDSYPRARSITTVAGSSRERRENASASPARCNCFSASAMMPRHRPHAARSRLPRGSSSRRAPGHARTSRDALGSRPQRPVEGRPSTLPAWHSAP